MTIRDEPWPAGTPCWVDISVPDIEVATAFYRDVLGWSLVDSGEDFGNYHIALVHDRAVAGVGPIMQEGTPTEWTLYMATDDVDATATLVGENGGTVIVPPMDIIPENGRMAIAADPTGAVVVMPAMDTPYGRVASVADPFGAVLTVIGGNAS